MNIKLHFDKIVPSGQALAHHDGKAWFCMGALPGESWEVRPLRQTPTYGIAELVSPIKLSENRNDIVAPNYAPWANVDYKYQLDLKRQILTELFAKPDVDLKIDQVVPSPVYSQYRNKLSFVLIKNDSGYGLGMHQRGSKEVIPTPEGCSLGHEDLNIFALAILDRLQKSPVAEVISEITLRRSQEGKIVAVLTVNKRKKADYQSLRAPGLSGLVVRTRSEEIWHIGDNTMTDSIAGTLITYPAGEFMQVNIPAYELAYEIIKAQISSSDRVLDLYGGAGAIGIPLAQQTYAFVLGVEINAASVELAKSTAADQNVKNYKCTATSADNLTDSFFDNISTVIVDPPRSGLSRELIDQLLKLKPAQIIYLSCDPVTQARDAMFLLSAYKGSKVTGFDFYPNTPHVESLVTFTLK